uniref:Tetratricopeptide repeat protein n=1 Tax=Desulfobacca acetoxidans TaxID=60893 RepID=A0A7C5AKA1_9BACT
MQSVRRLGLMFLLGTLVLGGSQCSRNQPASQVKPLKARQAAVLQEAYAPLPPQTPPKDREEQLTPERLEALGDLLLERRQYSESLVQYLQILKEDPKRYDVKYKVAVIFLLGGQYDQARQELTEILAARPEMLEAREALGLTHLVEKQYPQAVSLFQEVLRQDSQRQRTYHLLGLAYLAQNQPKEAIRVLERGALLNDKHEPLLTSLGQAYVQLKDYQRALLYLKKAQALNPKGKKVNEQLGMALAGLKRYSEAFEAFLKAGDEAQAYNNIGVFYFLEERYEDAAKCFQKALDLRPTFYQEAKINLQRALEKLQETKAGGH